MVTCNMFRRRPVASDESFWPFQYIEAENSGDIEGVVTDEDDSYTADFFTQRALEFVRSTTVRETFGLTLKDVLGMDYGMFLYLERLVRKLDKARQDQLDALDKENNKDTESN